VTIEHIGKAHIRKEDVVAQVLKQRGDRPGLVHILSAMEVCDAYKPWHDKQTHRTSVRPDNGKCLHYYFYFQDARLGLIYLRVPTWAPLRLQFYCNGHSWLARKLTAQGIGYTMADNAFVRIDDWTRAQELADSLSPDQLHRTLDRYAAQCCPVSDAFGQSYHWSLMQVEYAMKSARNSSSNSRRRRGREVDAAPPVEGASSAPAAISSLRRLPALSLRPGNPCNDHGFSRPGNHRGSHGLGGGARRIRTRDISGRTA